LEKDVKSNPDRTEQELPSQPTESQHGGPQMSKRGRNNHEATKASSTLQQGPRWGWF